MYPVVVDHNRLFKDIKYSHDREFGTRVRINRILKANHDWYFEIQTKIDQILKANLLGPDSKGTLINLKI